MLWIMQKRFVISDSALFYASDDNMMYKIVGASSPACLYTPANQLFAQTVINLFNIVNCALYALKYSTSCFKKKLFSLTGGI